MNIIIKLLYILIIFSGEERKKNNESELFFEN